MSGVLVTCRVTKSATSTRRSSVISSMPRSLARSADTNGSCATSFMPNEWARCATSLPMRPRPTTPSVLPASSTPSHFDRSHRPSTRAACACGTLRAWASSIAIVCSAVERMFDCGAFTTITPRAVATSTSTLSRPMPGAADDDEVGPRLEHLGRDLRGGPDDQRGGPRYHGEQLVGREAQLDVHVVAGVAELLQPAVGDLLGHEDARHRLPVWPGPVKGRQMVDLATCHAGSPPPRRPVSEGWCAQSAGNTPAAAPSR